MSAAVSSTDNLKELFSALEELLKRIADTDDPEIRRRRAQLREEMIAVQTHPAPAPDAQLIALNPASELPSEGWSRQAWAALAGAAVALSVFRHSS